MVSSVAVVESISKKLKPDTADPLEELKTIKGLDDKVDYLVLKLPRFRSFVERYLLPEVLTVDREELTSLLEKVDALVKGGGADRATLLRSLLAMSTWLNNQLRVVCQSDRKKLVAFYLHQFRVQDPDKLPDVVKDNLQYYLTLFLWLTGNHLEKQPSLLSGTEKSDPQSLTSRVLSLFGFNG